MAVNEALFPDLKRTGYVATSSPDPSYNCIAWAASTTSLWWWPDPDGFDYWPAGIRRERTLVAFMEMFATLGYAACPTGELQVDQEKIAIFATDEGPTHAARQLTNGRWTSKLGPDDDIEHDLDGLVSSAYGSVVQFMWRPRPTNASGLVSTP